MSLDSIFNLLYMLQLCLQNFCLMLCCLSNIRSAILIHGGCLDARTHTQPIIMAMHEALPRVVTLLVVIIIRCSWEHVYEMPFTSNTAVSALSLSAVQLVWNIICRILPHLKTSQWLYCCVRSNRQSLCAIIYICLGESWMHDVVHIRTLIVVPMVAVVK